MEHTRISVIGAGALGMLYASALGSSPDLSVSFLADSQRARRLRETTFIVNDREMSFDIATPADLESPPDLILVAVKTHHLAAIGPVIKEAAGPATIIISVLNGIDSERILESVCPQSTVLYTIALGMDAVRLPEDESPGPVSRVVFSTAGRLIIGTRDNDNRSPELARAREILDAGGITHQSSDDIHKTLWWKWMINVAMNQISAVSGATYGVFQTEPSAAQLMEGAMHEAVLVARAEGINLGDEDIRNWYPVLKSLGPDGKTSMLQDMEAGRKTEVETFGGRLIELAADHEIPVPINQTLVALIRIMEEADSSHG